MPLDLIEGLLLTIRTFGIIGANAILFFTMEVPIETFEGGGLASLQNDPVLLDVVSNEVLLHFDVLLTWKTRFHASVVVL